MANVTAKPKSAAGAGAAEWIIPVAAVALVFVMLVPLPALALDLLLAISIVASVLVLLSAVHILRPVQFSVFPSLLLLLTLFRLALNLASSRRILLHGNEGSGAAGHVIEAFGQFVVGGNYVVGFVLFLALIAIQYMVVSHGAVRTAEVTARFTLDAMPGKQMAIDADLNAGLIDEKQARARREQVSREAEFYGAMDGAARFNQRDSLATVLITVINIIAGFLIGVFQLDIPFRDALKTYTILTVGDGLVTIIPSLLVSVGSGIVVTRASSDNTLGIDVGKQLFGRSRPLWIAAGTMVALALIPGLPKIPFLLIAGIAGWLARRARSEFEKPVLATDAAAGAGATASSGAAAQEALEGLLKLDELGLEVGYALVPLVDAKQGGQLLQRVKALRRHLALQLGFIVPPIHITDNLKLGPREYVVYLRGVEIARWELRDDCLLAISSEATPPELQGFATNEPAFGVADRARSARAGAGLGLCGGGPDLGDGHPPGGSHQATRLRIAELPGDQAPAGPTGRKPSQAVRGAGAQADEPGRGAESAPAIAARTGIDSRPAHHPGEPAGRGCGQQEPHSAAGSGAAGAGARSSAAAAGRRRWVARRHTRSRDGRRVEPRLFRAGSSCRPGRVGAFVRSASAGRAEEAGGRAGASGDSGVVLQHPGALPSAPPAGAVPAQSGGALSGRGAPAGAGAIVGNDSMRRKHDRRSGLWANQ
jgi:hypothetical protein